MSNSTLARLLKEDKPYVGTEKKYSVFTDQEEAKILKFIVYQQEIGCGLSPLQIQLLLQEVMQSLKTSNPDRITGYEADLPMGY